MKSAIKIALFSALIVGSLAHNGSIKQRLSEKARKNLVEVAVDVEQDCGCTCDLPPITEPDLTTFCPLEMSGSSGDLPPLSGSAGTASEVVYGSVT
jgi:hypothetical protein